MVNAKSSAQEPEQEAFVITRTFNAPRELVWKVCTEPAHMQHWMGPKRAGPAADAESSLRVAKMEFRVGGTYHYCMKMGPGEMWGKIVYREIVPPERIVYIQSLSNEKGEIATHPMSPTWPREMLSTFQFTEQSDKTTLTITWTPYNATELERKTFDGGRKSMHGGWTGSLDNLTEYLATMKG